MGLKYNKLQDVRCCQTLQKKLVGIGIRGEGQRHLKMGWTPLRPLPSVLPPGGQVSTFLGGREQSRATALRLQEGIQQYSLER